MIVPTKPRVQKSERIGAKMPRHRKLYSWGSEDLPSTSSDDQADGVRDPELVEDDIVRRRSRPQQPPPQGSSERRRHRVRERSVNPTRSVNPNRLSFPRPHESEAVDQNGLRSNLAPGQANEVNTDDPREFPEASSQDAILSSLEILKRENEELRNTLYREKSATVPPPVMKHTWRTLHTIDPYVFLEAPQWTPGERGPLLQGVQPLQNVEFYLEQHPEIAFVFYKDYDLWPPKDLSKIMSKDGVFQTPEPAFQSLSLVSEHIKTAMKKVEQTLPHFTGLFPNFDAENEIEAPYIFMYYISPLLAEAHLDLTPVESDLLNQLRDSITASHGREYADAKACAARGMVTRRLMKYLIQPGDVLVHNKESPPRAYIAASWATGDGRSKDRDNDHSRHKHDLDKRTVLRRTKEEKYSWKINVWSWAFDGSFEKRDSRAKIDLKVADETDEVKVNTLSYFPLHFDVDGLRDTLEHRGKTFWKCRGKRFVSYQEEDHGLLNSVSHDQHTAYVEDLH